MDKHFLIDVTKLKSNADTLKYISFHGFPHVRLGRIYASVSHVNHICKYLVTPAYFSDDCLVTLDIRER